jgi:hypothetical protein
LRLARATRDANLSEGGFGIAWTISAAVINPFAAVDMFLCAFKSEEAKARQYELSTSEFESITTYLETW